MVPLMEPALRSTGCHLVTITTSRFLLPAALRTRARARSDRPPPYASAVSNQLVPPTRAAATISSVTCGSIFDQMNRWMLCASENCQVARPMGVISISVRPRRRVWGCCVSALTWSRAMVSTSPCECQFVPFSLNTAATRRNQEAPAQWRLRRDLRGGVLHAGSA
jgi:hypothetical protein